MVVVGGHGVAQRQSTNNVTLEDVVGYVFVSSCRSFSVCVWLEWRHGRRGYFFSKN